ncbi:unnamed protein product [Meloidogyne enterolobii]|uniref:Uncharacterized protein n=1 Tax=Meloidogyne enterolobii TaxID=390850 RepID=A0ACB1AXC8_MELEN
MHIYFRDNIADIERKLTVFFCFLFSNFCLYYFFLSSLVFVWFFLLSSLGHVSEMGRVNQKLVFFRVFFRDLKKNFLMILLVYHSTSAYDKMNWMS